MVFLNAPELQHKIGRKPLRDLITVTFPVEVGGFPGIQFKYVGQREGTRGCRAYSGR